ncbi:glycosyltransferase [Natrinema thermotolerans]|uniref:Glycosyltransferase n=1 Tax=Natrinema thermotolerans TaxID=121872 RepID=A0AAF0PF06_9EURY|nr:glycosyltransferase family 2 protein [Natrinema thermotolerans]QCC60451.1 glycosyltransferase family 2 protein [Natrinema thermotolerans]QCC61354.1 glycosyltransferase family 2 protein [Natrinema thermotolerans]WMT07483.1 glycosyltransferase [Natrinema thermotolerans]WMT08115.1 glycosyltransferase [Natrinema thermotolerans]
MDTKVSVIIPTYNRPQKLEEALDTVNNQSYENIEIIVVNDGSDVSYSTVTALDNPNVRYFKHSENQGACAARNTGIKQASGKFLAFLDDDDKWRQSKVREGINELETSDKDTKVCYSGVIHKNGNGDVKSVKKAKNRGWITDEILLGNFVGTFSNVIIEKEAVLETGLLDEDFPAWQDWEWYIRLSLDHKYTYNKSNNTVHVEHEEERMSSDSTRTESALYKMIDKHTDTARKYGLSKKFQSRCYSTKARYGLTTGNYDKAIQFSLLSLVLDKSNMHGLKILAAALDDGLGYRAIRSVKSLFHYIR